MTFILFDLESTFSYIFVKFDLGLTLVCDILDSPVHVSTTIGECGGDPCLLFLFYVIYSLLDLGRLIHFEHVRF